MQTSATPDMMQAMVDLSAMVFAATSPEDALQSLAFALDVQTVAIVRQDTVSDAKTILAQNTATSLVRTHLRDFEESGFQHYVILSQTPDHRDIMVLQSRLSDISTDQRTAIEAHGPYLRILWASRLDAFERTLATGRTPATQSVLHPDNPYDLTPTEFRVCGLIASGHRPASMAHFMNASMSTVRTHLRSIYAKTGLDGMVGVLRNIQTHGNDEKIAG